MKDIIINKKNILIVVLIITILSIITVASSKNKTKIEAKANIEKAKPIIELEQLTNCTSITEKIENDCIVFKIKNYNENEQISQIAQRFFIEFYSDNENTLDSIDYELYNTKSSFSEEHIVKLKDNKSEMIYLKPNEKQELLFKLKIKNVKSNLNIIDSLYINVSSESVEL